MGIFKIGIIGLQFAYICISVAVGALISIAGDGWNWGLKRDLSAISKKFKNVYFSNFDYHSPHFDDMYKKAWKFNLNYSRR